MGNQPNRSPSLEINTESTPQHPQSEPINKTKKCSFVYISPKVYQQEDIEQIKSWSLNTTLKENISPEQSVDNQQYNFELERNQSSLKGLFYQRQKEIGKVVVQWNQFIKIKQKNYLQDYKHIKDIGKGSFGAVSKVMKKHGKLYRAAKTIRMQSVTKKKANRDKLIAEILIMMKTDHPNINKLYEVYEWNRQYILIMDLCEGGDLFHMLKKEKGFSERRVAEIMKQILAGVVYLHKNKIVHRDLKPENLLYDIDSKLVKISDFGTGIEISNLDSKMNQLVGSPLYIAPEVITGNYDIKCDVWSCGVILYIMLCGVPPFTGNSQEQIFDNIRNEHLAFSGQIWKKRSNECKKLVARMLAKDPKQRINIQEAINSIWIKNTKEDQEKQVTAQFLNNLTRFYFQNKLKAVVYTYIASQLFSNKDKQRLMKCFKDIDKDNDGVIEKKELLEVFKTYKGEGFSQEELERIIELVDTNQSGHIDFTEFLVAASNEQELLCRERLENAFSYFDTDHSGYITADEIKQFLDDSQDTNDQIKKIFEQVDLNGDGKIELDQFINLLLDNSGGKAAVQSSDNL